MDRSSNGIWLGDRYRILLHLVQPRLRLGRIVEEMVVETQGGVEVINSPVVLFCDDPIRIQTHHSLDQIIGALAP